MNLIPERAYARSVVCLGICVSRIWQQLVAQAFALTSVCDGVGVAGITILAAVAAFGVWCVRHVSEVWMVTDSLRAGSQNLCRRIPLLDQRSRDSTLKSDLIYRNEDLKGGLKDVQ